MDDQVKKIILNYYTIRPIGISVMKEMKRLMVTIR